MFGFVNLLRDSYGFIVAQNGDGRHYYFNAGHLANCRMSELYRGAGVSFMDESGERGPVAFRVKLILETTNGK